jgi:hypothetical protein
LFLFVQSVLGFAVIERWSADCGAPVARHSSCLCCCIHSSSRQPPVVGLHAATTKSIGSVSAFSTLKEHCLVRTVLLLPFLNALLHCCFFFPGWVRGWVGWAFVLGVALLFGAFCGHPLLSCLPATLRVCVYMGCVTLTSWCGAWLYCCLVGSAVCLRTTHKPGMSASLTSLPSFNFKACLLTVCCRPHASSPLCFFTGILHTPLWMLGGWSSLSV